MWWQSECGRSRRMVVAGLGRMGRGHEPGRGNGPSESETCWAGAAATCPCPPFAHVCPRSRQNRDRAVINNRRRHFPRTNYKLAPTGNPTRQSQQPFNREPSGAAFDACVCLRSLVRDPLGSHHRRHCAWLAARQSIAKSHIAKPAGSVHQCNHLLGYKVILQPLPSPPLPSPAQSIF